MIYADYALDPNQGAMYAERAFGSRPAPRLLRAPRRQTDDHFTAGARSLVTRGAAHA